MTESTAEPMTRCAVAARFGLVTEGALDRDRALALADELLGWARARIGRQP